MRYLLYYKKKITSSQLNYERNLLGTFLHMYIATFIIYRNHICNTAWKTQINFFFSNEWGKGKIKPKITKIEAMIQWLLYKFLISRCSPFCSLVKSLTITTAGQDVAPISLVVLILTTTQAFCARVMSLH